MEHPHKFVYARRKVIKIDHVIKQKRFLHRSIYGFCDGHDDDYYLDDSDVAARHWLAVNTSAIICDSEV